MRYLIHYEGSGEGCDYTIGCNHAISIVNADSINAAIKKVSDALLSYPEGFDSQYDPAKLDKVTIYAIHETASFNLDQILLVKQAQEDAETRRQQEEKDRIQYEALKVRFEKSSH